jgi:hypothetical protein
MASIGVSRRRYGGILVISTVSGMMDVVAKRSQWYDERESDDDHFEQ